VPIVADIHFHYKRALEAADAGAACLGSIRQYRLGRPGARSGECRQGERLRDPHRGQCRSLERDLLEKYGEPCPEALVESALDHIRLLEDHDFRGI
jgi:(E)-4-hydroxy-3-methylbut-2-enyl-diphosphate synthase